MYSADMHLAEYIAKLNSTDQENGIWVDPEFPFWQYRVGSIHDDCCGVFIGTLSELNEIGGYQEADTFVHSLAYYIPT